MGETLKALRASPATTKAKAKFILATDGQTLEAEELITGETIACDYPDFPNHFGFLLPLAGISTIKEIKDNPIDVRATSRLNKLYVELLNENPDWAKAERRADMNHFMARLVFCFLPKIPISSLAMVYLLGRWSSTASATAPIPTSCCQKSSAP